jgi:hypothetical protein
MNLLRNSQTPQKNRVGSNNGDLDVSSLVSQLTDIKRELADLSAYMVPHTNGNGQEWQERSERLLEKLDSCIGILEKPVDSNDEMLSFNSVSSASPQQQAESVPVTPANISEIIAGENELTGSPTKKSLRDCIRQIAEENDPTTLKVGSQLLYLYLVNLSGKPDNPRYRKIYSSNQSFQKVESLAGGKDLLHAVGFVLDEGKNFLEWVPSCSPEEEIAALVLVKEAASSLSVLKSGKPSLELTEMALAKLSPQTSMMSPSLPIVLEQDPVANSAGAIPPPPAESEFNDSENIPQTPAGTMLKSPPMTKKLPFPDQPSGTPTNLADRLEQSAHE